MSSRPAPASPAGRTPGRSRRGGHPGQRRQQPLVQRVDRPPQRPPPRGLLHEAGPLLDRVGQLAEGVRQLQARRRTARSARPGADRRAGAGPGRPAARASRTRRSAGPGPGAARRGRGRSGRRCRPRRWRAAQVDPGGPGLGRQRLGGLVARQLDAGVPGQQLAHRRPFERRRPARTGRARRRARRPAPAARSSASQSAATASSGSPARYHSTMVNSGWWCGPALLGPEGAGDLEDAARTRRPPAASCGTRAR